MRQLLLCILLLFGVSSWNYSQESKKIILSNGLGKINKRLTIHKVTNRLGEPDSLVGNPKDRRPTKRPRNIILIYYKLGISFTFLDWGQKNKKFQWLTINNNSIIKLNNLSLDNNQSIQEIESVFGNEFIIQNKDEGHYALIYSNILRLTFKFNINHELQETVISTIVF